MTVVDEKGTTCLVDSNILLYAFIETKDVRKLNIAKSLIQNENIEITISTQIINEVCVNLIKKASFSEERIRQMSISFYNKYNVVEINKEIIFKASEIREHHKFSFWDSLIVAGALYANVEVLYSEDMQDGFVVDKTKIVNPFKQHM